MMKNGITLDEFESWLREYGRASKENDPRASAELFALDAEYYETPFAEPMRGRDAIHRYWDAAAQNLTDKESAFEIFAVRGNVGLARWKSEFVNSQTGNRVYLDCIFHVEFNRSFQCKTFREWWHTLVAEDGPHNASEGQADKGT